MKDHQMLASLGIILIVFEKGYKHTPAMTLITLLLYDCYTFIT